VDSSTPHFSFSFSARAGPRWIIGQERSIAPRKNKRGISGVASFYKQATT